MKILRGPIPKMVKLDTKQADRFQNKGRSFRRKYHVSTENLRHQSLFLTL